MSLEFLTNSLGNSRDRHELAQAHLQTKNYRFQRRCPWSNGEFRVFHFSLPSNADVPSRSPADASNVLQVPVLLILIWQTVAE